MDEIFKDIKGFEGEYQISTTGDVYSIKYGKRKLMKLRKDKYGYLRVCLCKDGKHKHFQVHRLVALAFIPNPDNLPQVNHKNEVKTDNRIENLEWCSAKYNIRYGTGNERRSKTNIETQGVKYGKSVAQYALDGTLIGIYHSLHEAERQTGYSHQYISQCCRGRYKQSYGFIWKYVE